MLQYIKKNRLTPLQKPTSTKSQIHYRTLHSDLIRAQLIPSTEQFLDIYINFPETCPHSTAGSLPKLKSYYTTVKPCKHPRCSTCQHLNCSKTFCSTRTGKTYTIRHNFSCSSKKLIYLITCTKCKKQYVGLTTQQLNTRINHHRSNIFNKKQTYISNHFTIQLRISRYNA